MCLSFDDDGQRDTKMETPDAEQGRSGVDPVAPIIEETLVADLVAPNMEEPPSRPPSVVERMMKVTSQVHQATKRCGQ